MDASLLDTLVKLASLGASGISIFAIFWIGWLILNPPEKRDPERHATLRFFMVVCVIVAVISAATSLVTAKFNADAISKLQTDNSALQKQIEDINQQIGDEKQTLASQHSAEIETLRAQIADLKQKEILMQQTARSLGVVLKSKEAANLENPSPEIESHIKLLREFLASMGVPPE